MPSFDIVSEVDQHELTNTLDQTNRELSNRFDFKGSDAKVEMQGEALLLEAENDFQVRQIIDVLYQKAAKRGIDVQALKSGPVEQHGMRARMRMELVQGVDKELGKKIIKLVKESKLKVQASIQGDQVRVTGKKRDDLQAAMAMLRQAELGVPLQYTNFRD